MAGWKSHIFVEGICHFTLSRHLAKKIKYYPRVSLLHWLELLQDCSWSEHPDLSTDNLLKQSPALLLDYDCLVPPPWWITKGILTPQTITRITPGLWLFGSVTLVDYKVNTDSSNNHPHYSWMMIVWLCHPDGWITKCMHGFLKQSDILLLDFLFFALSPKQLQSRYWL